MMEGGPVVVNLEGEEEGGVQLDLPAGFRFHPTDEEIISHYLTHKVVNPSFAATAIGQVDLNKCEPWDLPKKAKMGEKEWYFFCQRDRKYPTGMRTNRATEVGYWKATGKDKEIYGKSGGLVGMKKTLVFYKGRAPKGHKSNWVLHEFRLDGQLSYSVPKAEWVVCKVFHKNSTMINNKDSVKSYVEGIFHGSSQLPTLMDSPYNPNGMKTHVTNTSHEEEALISAPCFSIAPSTDGKYINTYNETTPNSMLFYSQNANANAPYQASSSLGNCYSHQQNGPCKVEHYSSNLSPSQDTGDISKPTYIVHHPASPAHLQDYDSFWNFQV